jgi:hypothetical protein
MYSSVENQGDAKTNPDFTGEKSVSNTLSIQSMLVSTSIDNAEKIKLRVNASYIQTARRQMGFMSYLSYQCREIAEAQACAMNRKWRYSPPRRAGIVTACQAVRQAYGSTSAADASPE